MFSAKTGYGINLRFVHRAPIGRGSVDIDGMMMMMAVTVMVIAKDMMQCHGTIVMVRDQAVGVHLDSIIE